MKIAILGDTHLGARSASNHFSQYFNKFFREEFYPYLVKHDVKHILQLGDLMDNRTSISIKALAACKDTWFGPLDEYGITMHTLTGNHDSLMKSSIKINSPELLLNEYDNVKCYSTPTLLEIDGTTISMIPMVLEDI